MHLALSSPPLNVLQHQNKKKEKQPFLHTVELFENTIIFDVCITYINVCESIINAKENTLEIDVQYKWMEFFYLYS